MISGSRALDYYLAYEFLKRLVLKFDEWPAYKTGVIDANGNVITPPSVRTEAQRASYGPYDIMISNLKKLLAKLPGGSTRLASLISAAFLMREHANDFTEQEFIDYYNKIMINEDAPTNAVGGGNVAGVGVGPQGEPGGKAAVLKKMLKRKQNVGTTTTS